MEVSIVVRYHDLIPLDRVVWELRRFCTVDLEPRKLKLVDVENAPRVLLPGGALEKIISEKKPHQGESNCSGRTCSSGDDGRRG